MTAVKYECNEFIRRLDIQRKGVFLDQIPMHWSPMAFYAPNRPECFVKYVNRYKSMYKNLLQLPCVKELVKQPIK